MVYVLVKGVYQDISGVENEMTAVLDGSQADRFLECSATLQHVIFTPLNITYNVDDIEFMVITESMYYTLKSQGFTNQSFAFAINNKIDQQLSSSVKQKQLKQQKQQLKRNTTIRNTGNQLLFGLNYLIGNNDVKPTIYSHQLLTYVQNANFGDKDGVPLKYHLFETIGISTTFNELSSLSSPSSSSSLSLPQLPTIESIDISTKCLLSCNSNIYNLFALNNIMYGKTSSRQYGITPDMQKYLPNVISLLSPNETSGMSLFYAIALLTQITDDINDNIIQQTIIAIQPHNNQIDIDLKTTFRWKPKLQYDPVFKYIQSDRQIIKSYLSKI